MSSAARNLEPWPMREYGFFPPKGTPASIVHKLNEATVATLNTPSVQQRANEIGFTIVSPERRTPQ